MSVDLAVQKDDFSRRLVCLDGQVMCKVRLKFTPDEQMVASLVTVLSKGNGTGKGPDGLWEISMAGGKSYGSCSEKQAIKLNDSCITRSSWFLCSSRLLVCLSPLATQAGAMRLKLVLLNYFRPRIGSLM